VGSLHRAPTALSLDSFSNDSRIFAPTICRSGLRVGEFRKLGRAATAEVRCSRWCVSRGAAKTDVELPRGYRPYRVRSRGRRPTDFPAAFFAQWPRGSLGTLSCRQILREVTSGALVATVFCTFGGDRQPGHAIFASFVKSSSAAG
jgi:hypothetical protein